VEVECSLVEAARAGCQFECRTITVICHTETGLHMFNCTTICDIRSSGTGKAVDPKVLSVSSEFYGLKGEVTICKSLQLEVVSGISRHLEHITVVRLTRECDQELAVSKWRLGEIKRNVPSNRVGRVPLERESKPGFEDGEGPPSEVRVARGGLKNGAGKGSSQEGDKGDQLCT